MVKKKVIKTVTTTVTDSEKRKKETKFIKKAVKKRKKKLTNAEIQEKLLENSIRLQKVNADLAVKFDSLSKNIAHLLELFELSAKSFMEKYGQRGDTEEEEMLKKLDTLLEQNKTIAKGLTLLEEKVRHKLDEEREHEERVHGLLRSEGINKPRPKPLPRN